MNKIIGLNGQSLTTDRMVVGYTNQDLYSMFNEYNELVRGLSGILLKSKLREFYNNNFLRYKSLIEQMEKLRDEHFVMEEDSSLPTGKKVKTVEIEVDGKKKHEPVMNEGFTLEMYKEASKQLMILLYNMRSLS